jgi:hypothetical protein
MSWRKKIITYVKDERSNLHNMTPTLKYVVSCDIKYIKSFQGSCFSHAFSKACQYASTDENLYKDLKYVSVITTQSYL